MMQHRLFILVLLGFTLAVAGVLAVSVGFVSGSTRVVAALLACAGLLLLGFAAWRVFVFLACLRQHLRTLISGDFTVKMDDHKGRDELGRLRHEVNRFGEHLGQYDALRAERVRFSQGVLDTVFHGSSQGILLIDIETGTIRVNAAMSKRMGTEQQTVKLGSLEKLPANSEFMALYERAALTEKVPVEGQVVLRFPAIESQADVFFRMVPVKDRGDTVKLVAAFAS